MKISAIISYRKSRLRTRLHLATLTIRSNVSEPTRFVLDGGYAYVAFIQNASITYAFYYLVLFYLALHDYLSPYNPTLKFICIKSVLFLSFWQGVVVAGFAQ